MSELAFFKTLFDREAVAYVEETVPSPDGNTTVLRVTSGLLGFELHFRPDGSFATEYCEPMY